MKAINNEIEAVKINSLLSFWKTKESKDAKAIFSGNIAGETIKIECRQGDQILTEEGEIYKFIHGSQDTTKYPYLEFIKKIEKPKFEIDDEMQFDGKTFQYLGIATIYKLTNNKFYWDY